LKLLLRLVKVIVIFVVLTILSQVGGVIYLIYKPFGLQISKSIKSKISQKLLRFGLFLGFMIISSLWIIPPIAQQFGRTPLPISATSEIPLKPAHWLFILTNRHYVTPKLKKTIIQISQQMQSQYPEIQVIYLDANFPFLDNFPLFPHLSHDDGEKLDIAFVYKSRQNHTFLSETPTWSGYGYCEKPKKGEYNQSKYCTEKGYWMYNLLSKFTNENSDYKFDYQANSYLLKLMVKNPAIRKIFLEPHLKTRLKLLRYSKIRFHGCHSVRHDDHIHLQL